MVVCLCAAILTGWAWRWTHTQEDAQARQEFYRSSDQAIDRLNHRLKIYAQMLQAVEGFHVAAVVDQGSWRAFSADLDLDREFPGMQALGVSTKVAAADLTQFIAARRAEGAPDFQVYPAGSQPYYQPVSYIAPENPPNLKVLGFDLGSEEIRRAAMDRARDLSVTAMSGKIQLLQDGKQNTPGFLLLHPLYHGEEPADLVQRRERHEGYAFGAFRMRDFMQAIFPQTSDDEFVLRVFDAMMPPGKESLMFDSAPDLERSGRRFHSESAFSFGGSSWRVAFDSKPRFESSIDHARSSLVLPGGLIITLLLTLLAWSLADSRARTLRHVDAVTADLRASRERFELVIGATEEGVWDRDLVARTTYLSPRFEEMLGYPRGGLMGKIETLRDLIHPDDVPGWDAAFEAHLQQRRAYDVEYRVRHSSGEWRWFRSRGQAVWDADGKPVRMVGSLSDVTAMKVSALHLEQQREFLARLIDVIPEPIVVKDRQSRYVMVNRAFTENIGKPAAEIVGKTTHDLLPEGTAAGIVALDQGTLETGEDQIREISIYDARYRTQRNVVIKKSLTMSPDGEPLMVSIHSDVTELRRALARFEAVVDDTPLVAVVGLDRAGRIEYWNHACETLYDLPRGQVVGKEIGELLFTGEATANFQRVIESVWTSGRPAPAMEYLIPLKNGKRVWVYSALYPVVENGVVAEVFGMGVDISARRRIERELKLHRDHLEERVAEQTAHLLRAKSEAERANQAKSEFLANMSHELRTPLHGVLSFAKIGAAKGASAAPEKLVGYFERICESGERLFSLLNDLLDLSKLEAGKMTLELRRENLLDLFMDVVKEFETVLESKPLALVVEPITVEPTGQMDATRIKQVLRNLLSNAIKFTPSGRSIHMSISRAELRAGHRATDTKMVPALCLRLADEGIGVPEDEMEAIFDKFVQSSRTRTGAGGTGLGLAICKEIVDAHRGAIGVKNNAVGGATFEVVLPCAG